MLHYYKFKDITKNPLLQENLLNKKSVFRVLSTISRDSTITRYTITSVDCILHFGGMYRLRISNHEV